MQISKRELELPNAVIATLLKIAAEDHSVISLGPGEPDFSLPKPLVKSIKKIAKDCNHYSAPGGRFELKEAIIKKMQKENRIKAKPENIIVTCGSQEALLLGTACTMDVSHQALIPNPGFLGYLPEFELFNAVPVPIQLKEENNFEPCPDDIKKSINKKTKVILLNSPANPTGNVIRKKIMEEVADIAVDKDLYIFSDEAYEKIIYDKKHHSIGGFNGMKDYVLSFYSFSKSYAMCGFRLGYCVGPENVIGAMTKSHIYTTLSAPTLSQKLGVDALSLNKKYIDNMVKEYRRRRDLIVPRLNEIGFPTVKPDGAFYAFSNIKSHAKDSFKFAKKLLEKAKVAAVPGKEFGFYGEGYLRFSYATDYKLIEKALDRIEKFVR